MPPETDPTGNAALATGAEIDPSIIAAAAGTGSQLDTEAKLKALQDERDQWMKRFTGMQGSYQKQQEAAAAAAAKLEETNKLVEALTAAKTEVETKLTEFEKGLLEKSSQLEMANTKVQRYETVLNKYPQLLPFLDLLPEGTGEEFEKKLNVFAERLQTMGAESLASFKKMSTPPAPPATETSSSDYLKQAQAAARSGDMEGYHKYYDLYLSGKAPANL